MIYKNLPYSIHMFDYCFFNELSAVQKIFKTQQVG